MMPNNWQTPPSQSAELWTAQPNVTNICQFATGVSTMLTVRFVRQGFVRMQGPISWERLLLSPEEKHSFSQVKILLGSREGSAEIITGDWILESKVF